MSAAARPGRDDEADRARWSAAHGSVDPDASVWISGYLTVVHRLARPLAHRGVAPAAVTAAGVAVSALVPWAASLGDAWPLAVVVLVVAAGLLDGVDGAVARMTGTATPWGSVLDTIADRCSDLLLLATLGVLGAPWWLCVAAAAATLLLESVRASATAAGMTGVGVLTVWERPSRIVLVSFAAAFCGAAWPAGQDELVDDIATGGASIAAALAVWSVLHLSVVARRELRRDPPGG